MAVTTPKILAITALLLGVTAMTCTVIPMIVYDEPTEWPFGRREREKPAADDRAAAGPGAKGEGAVTVQTKRFSLSFGRRKKAAEAPQTQPAASDAAGAPGGSAPAPAPPAAPVSPVRKYKIAGVGLALVGLTLAPFSWRHRRNRPLAVAAVGLCCLALAWQYIIVGIVIGVAIAILFIILSALST